MSLSELNLVVLIASVRNTKRIDKKSLRCIDLKRLVTQLHISMYRSWPALMRQIKNNVLGT